MNNQDFTIEELLNTLNMSYQNYVSDIGKCNILVIGKTGVGKSTLINTVFREPLAQTGEGYPVTDDIRQYRKNDFPITVYDTPGLELNGVQVVKVKKDISDLIDSHLENITEQIHIIWYCINDNSDRLETEERDWLELLSSRNIPVILVVTKTRSKRSKFVAWLETQNLPVRQIIPILAESEEIDENIVIKEHGLDDLVLVTVDLLPEAVQNAFANGTKNIELKARKAFKEVTKYVSGAGLIGASPIPWSDAPILATSQITMLIHITVIFGLDFDKAFISNMVFSLAGVGGTTMIGRAFVSGLLKMIPGVGTVAGGIVSAGTASTLTLAVGLAYIEALKKYMKAKLKGEEMPLSYLSTVLTEQYEYYTKSGRKTLKDDDSDDEPRAIPIS